MKNSSPHSQSSKHCWKGSVKVAPCRQDHYGSSHCCTVPSIYFCLPISPLHTSKFVPIYFLHRGTCVYIHIDLETLYLSLALPNISKSVSLYQEPSPHQYLFPFASLPPHWISLGPFSPISSQPPLGISFPLRGLYLLIS